MRRTPLVHGPQRVLGGLIEVPRVTKERGDVGREQLDQLPGGVRIAAFYSREPLIDSRARDELHAAPLEELTMTVEQLDTGQPQCQAPRALELFVRQRCAHRHAVMVPARPAIQQVLRAVLTAPSGPRGVARDSVIMRGLTVHTFRNTSKGDSDE